jgi:dienelactone hydrolase
MRTTLPSGTAVEIVQPEGATGALVLAPDIMGLRPLFDDHVNRLSADLGWAVAAFEPFPGEETMPVDERLAAMPSKHDQRWVDDALATADLLGADDVSSSDVSILGFCMGGMVVMKATATGRFRKGIAFYGMIRNPASWASTTNTDAIDALTAHPGTAERVLAIVGTEDGFTPADHVDELEAAGATASSTTRPVRASTARTTRPTPGAGPTTGSAADRDSADPQRTCGRTCSPRLRNRRQLRG